MICCLFPCKEIPFAKECHNHPIASSFAIICMVAFAAIAITLISSIASQTFPHAAFWGLAGACVTAFVLGVISFSCVNHPKHFVANL